MTTMAPVFRQVDALTGRVAELERECDEWCHRCSDAIRQRDVADSNVRYLSSELVHLRSENDSLRAERTELYKFIDGLRSAAS